MTDGISIVIITALVSAVIVVLCLTVLIFRRGERCLPQWERYVTRHDENLASIEKHPFEQKPYLMNKGEIALYCELIRKIGPKKSFIIAPQVALAAIVVPKKDGGGDSWKAVYGKYVDFLICDRGEDWLQSRPILVIEYNGAGHNGGEDSTSEEDNRGKNSDEIKAKVLEQAGISLLVIEKDENPEQAVLERVFPLLNLDAEKSARRRSGC